MGVGIGMVPVFGPTVVRPPSLRATYSRCWPLISSNKIKIKIKIKAKAKAKAKNKEGETEGEKSSATPRARRPIAGRSAEGEN